MIVGECFALPLLPLLLYVLIFYFFSLARCCLSNHLPPSTPTITTFIRLYLLPLPQTLWHMNTHIPLTLVPAPCPQCPTPWGLTVRQADRQTARMTDSQSVRRTRRQIDRNSSTPDLYRLTGYNPTAFSLKQLRAGTDKSYTTQTPWNLSNKVEFPSRKSDTLTSLFIFFLPFLPVGGTGRINGRKKLISENLIVSTFLEKHIQKWVSF